MILGIATLLLLVSGGKAFGQARGTKIKIQVDDPRPVAAALDKLEARYSWPISYEDQDYLWPNDQQDVTAEVSRGPQSTKRIMVPRGGGLAVTFDSSVAREPSGAAKIIGQILDAEKKERATVFTLRLDPGGRYVIVPQMARDASGELALVYPVLDTPITIVAKERDGMQMLDAICKAVSEQTHRSVVNSGLVGQNFFPHQRTSLGADNKAAREVLEDFLDSTGSRISWDLLCDPRGTGADNGCTLNLKFVKSHK